MVLKKSDSSFVFIKIKAYIISSFFFFFSSQSCALLDLPDPPVAIVHMISSSDPQWVISDASRSSLDIFLGRWSPGRRALQTPPQGCPETLLSEAAPLQRC